MSSSNSKDTLEQNSLRLWWQLPEIEDLNGNTCRAYTAVDRALHKSACKEKAMKWLMKNKDICLSPSLKVYIDIGLDMIDLNEDLWNQFLQKNEAD